MSILIKIPKNIIIQTNYISNKINFKGPLGNLSIDLLNDFYLKKKKNKLYLNIFTNSKFYKNKKKYLYLYKSIFQNNIKGVTQGFKYNLFLKGLGFKVSLEKNKLIFKLGFSHSIEIKIPNNIFVKINKSNEIILKSINKEELTQFIFKIKNYKKPEPYKGKGILLKNEKILIKEGKKK